jgi:hypothetical protein
MDSTRLSMYILSITRFVSIVVVTDLLGSAR